MIIEVSIGEVIDKLSILEIKKERITDNLKLVNVNSEYEYLLTKLKEEINFTPDRRYYRLKEVNEILWDVEDKLREHEKNNHFDDVFIDLARTVYITNDKRSKIKREINIEFGSKFIEEKSYSKY